jgi:hypothetical protein
MIYSMTGVFKGCNGSNASTLIRDKVVAEVFVQQREKNVG